MQTGYDRRRRRWRRQHLFVETVGALRRAASLRRWSCRLAPRGRRGSADPRIPARMALFAQGSAIVGLYQIQYQFETRYADMSVEALQRIVVAGRLLFEYRTRARSASRWIIVCCISSSTRISRPANGCSSWHIPTNGSRRSSMLSNLSLSKDPFHHRKVQLVVFEQFQQVFGIVHDQRQRGLLALRYWHM